MIPARTRVDTWNQLSEENFISNFVSWKGLDFLKKNQRFDLVYSKIHYIIHSSNANWNQQDADRIQVLAERIKAVGELHNYPDPKLHKIFALANKLRLENYVDAYPKELYLYCSRIRSTNINGKKQLDKKGKPYITLDTYVE